MINHLKEILGSGNFIESEEAKAPFLKDQRGYYYGKAALIALPPDVETLSRLVSACYNAGIAMVPQGGNTGLVGGATPDISGQQIIISLKKIAKIRQIDPVANIITAEAGVILADVQNAATAAQRLYPVSLGSQGSCMIGGTIATNAGGVNVLHYGNTREQVLGLEVVLPGGRVWHGLKTLYKDNTGYDLKQCFIGSEGTLGIITAATLRLYSRPHDSVVIFAALPNIEAVLETFMQIRQNTNLTLTAFELMSQATLALVLETFPNYRPPLAMVQPWYILFEITGEAISDLIENMLTDLLDEGIIADAVIAMSESQAKDFWLLRESVNYSSAKKNAAPFDISVPLSKLTVFIKQIHKKIADESEAHGFLCYGHIGDGNLHLTVIFSATLTKQELFDCRAKFSDLVYSLVMQHDGSISAEHGLGQLKCDYINKWRSPLDTQMQQMLKRTFDPKNLMNPGKVVNIS